MCLGGPHNERRRKGRSERKKILRKILQGDRCACDKMKAGLMVVVTSH